MLIPQLTEALQQPLADAAELFPIAAGPLANAQAALGVLGDLENTLGVGLGALLAIAGVADATGNTVKALIDGVQSGDFETTFNTIVNEAAAGTQAALNGVLSPTLGLVAGLQRLREAIADAITTPSFPPPPDSTAAVTSAPTKAAQSFTLTAPLQKIAPAPTDDTTPAEETTAAVDPGTADPSAATTEVTTETTPTTKETAKETAKDGNLVILDSTATKSDRPRAGTGSNFAKGLRDAAKKTIKGITGFGRDKKSDSSSSTSTGGTSESGSAGSTSGGSSASGSSTGDGSSD